MLARNALLARLDSSAACLAASVSSCARCRRSISSHSSPTCRSSALWASCRSRVRAWICPIISLKLSTRTPISSLPLVTHVGQERALGAAGLFGGLLGGQRLLLRALPPLDLLAQLADMPLERALGLVQIQSAGLDLHEAQSALERSEEHTSEL